MKSFRTGFGFDVHAFAENREFILGGVKIPFHKGLLGHSDADVLVHAIIDALLGAAALGDIGTHYPDNVDDFKGISSLILLRKTNDLLISKGFNIGNIDSTIVLQEPKIKSFTKDMISNIANTLMIEEFKISVKATTTEHLGFTGRGEGVSAYSTVLIYNS